MVQYYLSRESLYSAIADGDAFIVSQLMSISSNESGNIHIQNPHDDKVMWIGAISVMVEGNAEFYLHDGFDSITDGTEVTIQNALMDSAGGAPDSGPFQAYYNSTYTPSGPDATIPLGFTTDGGPLESESLSIFPSAIEPDREFVLDIENQDASERKTFVGILLITSY